MCKESPERLHVSLEDSTRTVTGLNICQQEYELIVFIFYKLEIFVLSKKNYTISARSGTVFKIADPTGDCPEHGHGFFGLVEVTALGKDTIIFL